MDEIFKDMKKNAGYYILDETENHALGFSPTSPSSFAIWIKNSDGEYLSGEYREKLSLYAIADLHFVGIDTDKALQLLTDINFDFATPLERFERMSRGSPSLPESIARRFLRDSESLLSESAQAKAIKTAEYLRNYSFPYGEVISPKHVDEMQQIDHDAGHSEIEKEVIDFANKKLIDIGIQDVQIIDAVEYVGDGEFGTNILLEYKGDIREDDFFSILHESDFTVDGKKIDINPIKAEKSGTIEQYLEALRENEELPPRQQPSAQKLVVYVCSPLAGEIEENIRKAREYSKFVAFQGNTPIAPHITELFNDTIPEERELGLSLGIDYLHRADELWVFDDRISNGMANEIRIAHDELNIPIYSVSENMSEKHVFDYNKFLENERTDETMQQDKDVKLRNLVSGLDNAATSMMTPEKFAQYLNTVANCHNYSANNCLLIASQSPNATLVASYDTWKNDFRRQVKHGEKGIEIIKREVQPKSTIIKDENKLDENGLPVYHVIKTDVPSYRRDFLFDVSQTQGEPIPQLSKYITAGTIGYANLANAISNVSKLPALSEKSAEEGSRLEIAIHEMAYLALGQDSLNKSLEGEGIAFTLCGRLGIDTSQFDFSDISKISHGMNAKDIRERLETIHNKVHELIDSIDRELAAHQLLKTPMQKQQTIQKNIEGGEGKQDIKKSLEQKLSESQGKVANNLHQQKSQSKTEREEL